MDRFPRWLWPAGLLACASYLLAEAVVLGGDFGFPLDDSWIHLQFARHLATGEGLAYNPGEWVTGSTAPLWTALLSLVFLLSGAGALGVQVMAVKALGVTCYLGVVHATFRFARELELSRRLATLGALLTLATGWLVWSALSGMEVNLFVLFSLWGMILHLRERREPQRPPLSLPVLAVSVLARPEGALLLLLALADRLLSFERPEGTLRWTPPSARRLAAGWAPGLALGALGVVGTFIFYAWAGGSLLPTTFSVKGSGVLRWLPEPRYLRVVWGILFLPQPWMALLAPAGALVLIERLGTRRDRGLLPVLWLFGLPLAYSLMSPLGPSLIAGNFGRYYFPLFPVMVVLGLLGIERVTRMLTPEQASLRPGSTASRRRVSLALVAALLLLWPSVAHLFRHAVPYARNVANVQDSNVRMARFLGRRLPSEALLAVNDIGAFKYFLPNRILDVVGIASPEAWRFRQERMAAGATFYEAVAEYLERHRPDYVAIFPEWLPQLAADPRFEPLYVLPIPDNRTMGGDEIALFATPWTRFPLADVERRPGDPIPVDELTRPRPGAAAPDEPPPPVPLEGALDADPADRPLPR